MSEVQEKLMELLKDSVDEKDIVNLSIDMNLDDIPFLKNEWSEYGASRFFRSIPEKFDVNFYRYDAGKIKTLRDLGELIERKQKRRKKLNDPRKKYICYSAKHKNGLEYIGITCVGLDRRKYEHINDAKKGKGGLFQQALKVLGADNFEWKIEGDGGKKEMERLEMDLIQERNANLNSQFIDWESHDEWRKFQEWSRETDIQEKRLREHYIKEGLSENEAYFQARYEVYGI